MSHAADGDLNKQLLFIWLNYPQTMPLAEEDSQSRNEENVKLTIEFVIKQASMYGIPDGLVIRKIIGYLILIKNNKDDIITRLIDLKILGKYDVNKISDMIDESNDKTINSPNIDQCIALANQYTNVSDLSHKSYPLPNPKYGRPKLTFLHCYHEGCNKNFDHVNDLVQHLCKMKCYTKGFHFHHEFAVDDLNLTPEKVIENKITKCPSWICDRGEFQSPEDLVFHFKMLGISPFWVPGTVFDTESSKLNLDTYNNLYAAEECVICMDRKPEVIFFPCMHNIACFDCYNGFKVCPMCRTNINSIVPF